MPRRLRLLFATGTGTVAAAILLVLVVMAVIAPTIWGKDAGNISVVDAMQSSSSQHWFGTDHLGRDIFARTLFATRLSLELAGAASGIAVVIGIPLGLAPSVLGSLAGRFVNSIIGATLAFPALLTAMFVGTIIGIGATGAVFGIGIALTPLFARLTQTMAASIAGLDYVSAARTMGIGRLKIMTRHILPNVAEPLVITASMSVAYSLLGISTLSFLGLGVRPPSYDWGALLGEGLQSIYQNPLAALGPGACIAIAGIGFSLFGEAVSRTFADSSSTRSSLRVARRMSLESARAAKARAARPAEPERSSSALVDLEELQVQFPGDRAPFTAVRGVSLTIGAGERIGIVGESGSGKSLTVMAIAQLLAYPAAVSWGELRIFGADVSSTPPRRLRTVLGTNLAMVFQDPMSSLNPALRIGRQMSEVAEVHSGLKHSAALELSARKLSDVGIPRAPSRLRDYPHEYSGGMRQRVMIAMGLMETPKLIIADEPTTALDVTVQRQILSLLADINEKSGAAVLLISHDIAVVTTVCERVVVMYAGRIVEELPTHSLIENAMHHYTRALIASVPDMTTDRTVALATIAGRPPSVETDPEGCAYAPRCPMASDRCRTERPVLAQIGSGHRVACWHPHEPAALAGLSPTPAAEANPGVAR